GSRKGLIQQIEQGFPFLPAGCHMELDRVAQDIVLQNIRQAVPSQWQRKVEELRALAGQNRSITLARFLDDAELDLEDVYLGSKPWSDLRAAAGLAVAAPGLHEAVLRRACGRIVHIDDPLRIDTYRRFLQSPSPPHPPALAEGDRRLLRMLVASIA